MNLIAQAQSGTGKTATFVLTMLSRVVPSNKWPQCLCLAPTYELAMQIGQVVKKMSEFLPEIKIRYAVKGERSKFFFVNAFHMKIYWTISILKLLCKDLKCTFPNISSF